LPSPIFRINGGTAGVKASVSASTSTVATLDSTDGVRSVTWSIIGTDDTTTAASYTLVQSGSVGQTVTFTSGAAGTALILRAEINGGVNLQTEQADASTRATAKIYVPAANGREVCCVNEQLESSATHGWTGLVNAPIRGSVTVNSTSITSTTTLSYWQTARCNPTAGGFTIDLPTAAGRAGVDITVKNVSTSTNPIVVDGNASETIDGTLTFAMGTSRQSITVRSDGSNWMIVAAYP
jgi:hypothetical protein